MVNLNYLQEDPDGVVQAEDDPEAFDQDVLAANQVPMGITPPPPMYQAAPAVAPPPLPPAVAGKVIPVVRYTPNPSGDFGGEASNQQTGDFIGSRPGTIMLPGPTPIGLPPAESMITPDLPDDAMDVQPSLPGAFQHRVPGKDTTYEGALETQRQMALGMPVRPTPSWWNRLAGAAVGAAAGYSNAARRAAPIDIGQAVDSVLYPGYDQKLAAFNSKMDLAKQQTENLGQQLNARYAAQKAQTDATLKAAQAQQALMHGEYWLKRSEQERNQWKIDPKTGDLYNTINGQIVPKTQSQGDRYKDAIALGANEADARFYALNGKLPTTTQRSNTQWQSYLDANGGDPVAALKAKQADDIRRARESRDPEAAGRAADAAADRITRENTAIDDKKTTDIGRVMTNRNAQILRINNATNITDPKEKQRQIDEANKAARSQLQAIQDNYARTIRARHGTADDYDVNPDLTYSPRQAAQNPYAPKAQNPYRPAQQ